jgi:hypothetical protein
MIWPPARRITGLVYVALSTSPAGAIALTQPAAVAGHIAAAASSASRQRHDKPDMTMRICSQPTCGETQLSVIQPNDLALYHGDSSILPMP